MKIKAEKTIKTRKKPKKNPAETTDFFCALIRTQFKTEIVKEFRFYEGRKFAFDYAIPEYKIAIEKDGGIWMKGGGAHSRPQNILRDMEKLTLASVNGWVVIRRTPAQMSNKNISETLNLIKTAIDLIKKRNFATTDK